MNWRQDVEVDFIHIHDFIYHLCRSDFQICISTPDFFFQFHTYIANGLLHISRMSQQYLTFTLAKTSPMNKGNRECVSHVSESVLNQLLFTSETYNFDHGLLIERVVYRQFHSI